VEDFRYGAFHFLFLKIFLFIKYSFMHTKKLIGIFAAVASLALLAGCGSAQPGTPTDDTVISGTTETTSVETPTNLTKNEQCIEIMAYSLK
jgi:hypothetical protein